VTRLREALAEEFETLWQIDQRCFAPGIAYSRRELRSYMRSPSFTLVAEAGEPAAIAGFVMAFPDGRGTGEITTLDVLAEHRRRGLGASLLTAAEQRLRECGCSRVALQVAVDNGGALAFYERLGYTVAGIIPRYYLGSIDALHMEKDLLPAREVRGA
jgi:ribosomal-protein-alanine N-acetyltransferase